MRTGLGEAEVKRLNLHIQKDCLSFPIAAVWRGGEGLSPPPLKLKNTHLIVMFLTGSLAYWYLQTVEAQKTNPTSHAPNY